VKGIAIKRFDAPDEARTFARGGFGLLNVGGMTLGRARYEPGWKWSVDVGPVVSGRAMVKMRDGTEVELGAGDYARKVDR